MEEKKKKKPLPMGRSRDSASKDKLGWRVRVEDGRTEKREARGIQMLSGARHQRETQREMNMQKSHVFAEPHRAHLCRE